MARPGFMQHRKFRRLVQILGLPEAHVRGLVECLWEPAYESGDDYIGDSTDVEAAAKWTGEPGLLTRAFLDCGGPGNAGLIDPSPEKDGAYIVHELHDHAPEYVKNRWRREEARRHAGEKFREQQEKAPKKKASPPAEPELVFPKAIDTPEFRAAWADWVSYRRERKLTPWKPMTVNTKFNEWQEWGSARACAAIRHSIGNGYQGVFEPSGGEKASRRQPGASVPVPTGESHDGAVRDLEGS